jgi:hypothetical protein
LRRAPEFDLILALQPDVERDLLNTVLRERCVVNIASTAAIGTALPGTTFYAATPQAGW